MNENLGLLQQFTQENEDKHCAVVVACPEVPTRNLAVIATSAKTLSNIAECDKSL